MLNPIQSQLCLCGLRLKCFASNRVLDLITFWWTITNPRSLQSIGTHIWLLSPLHPWDNNSRADTLYECLDTTQLLFIVIKRKLHFSYHGNMFLIAAARNFILAETSVAYVVCNAQKKHRRNQCMQRFNESTWGKEGMGIVVVVYF